MDDRKASTTPFSCSPLSSSSSSFSGSSGTANNGSNVKVMRRAYSSTVRGAGGDNDKGIMGCYTFQMPAHYPRYTLADYESMSESRLDRLLDEYGLFLNDPSASLADKRAFAIGAFLWKTQKQNTIEH